MPLRFLSDNAKRRLIISLADKKYGTILINIIEKSNIEMYSEDRLIQKIIIELTNKEAGREFLKFAKGEISDISPDVFYRLSLAVTSKIVAQEIVDVIKNNNTPEEEITPEVEVEAIPEEEEIIPEEEPTIEVPQINEPDLL